MLFFLKSRKKFLKLPFCIFEKNSISRSYFIYSSILDESPRINDGKTELRLKLDQHKQLQLLKLSIFLEFYFFFVEIFSMMFLFSEIKIHLEMSVFHITEKTLFFTYFSYNFSKVKFIRKPKLRKRSLLDIFSWFFSIIRVAKVIQCWFGIFLQWKFCIPGVSFETNDFGFSFFKCNTLCIIWLDNSTMNF